MSERFVDRARQVRMMEKMLNDAFSLAPWNEHEPISGADFLERFLQWRVRAKAMVSLTGIELEGP